MIFLVNLKVNKKDTSETIIPEDIQSLAEQRRQAKQEKNRSLADELRKQIDDAGYTVLDTNDSYAIQRK